MKQTVKQTEAKARRFHAGLVAALAVFAVLGSCDGGRSRQAPPPPP
ncbi:MAG: hypothetical protein LBF60_07435 [Treponema sp.]|nr:hypothetical protein [Treponema sp.]